MAARKTAGCNHERERLIAYLPHPLESDSVSLVWCGLCGALGTKHFNGRTWKLRWQRPQGKTPALAKAATGASRA